MLPHYNNGMRRAPALSAVLFLALGFTLVSRAPGTDPRSGTLARGFDPFECLLLHLKIGFDVGRLAQTGRLSHQELVL
jgi:hypothetical protein